MFGIQKSLMVGEDEEIPADITIQFASTRPVTVEIEDDILWITIRVIRLKQVDHSTCVALSFAQAIDLRRTGCRPDGS